MSSLELPQSKSLAHSLEVTQTQMLWAIGMAFCFLAFWFRQLPSFMENEFPIANTFTVLQVSDSNGRITQAHSNASNMTLSGIPIREARRIFGTAEIALPNGSNEGDRILLYSGDKSEAAYTVILDARAINVGKAVVVATKSEMERLNLLELHHVNGTIMPRENVRVLREPKQYSKADHGIEFSPGEQGQSGFITLVSPVIENRQVGNVNTRFQNLVPCAAPCFVQLDNKQTTFVAAFKSIKLNLYVMHGAIFLVFVLGLVVYYYKFGNIGIYIALSALLSMRLFMAVSLMKSQVDYAAQVFLATAELLIIPTLLANLESLHHYMRRGDVVHRSAISVFLPPTLSVLMLLLWAWVFAWQEVDGTSNSVAYFVNLNWSNFSTRRSYWVEFGFVLALLIAYFLDF